ncbi:MAG: transposase [Candidatus Aminicenantes bacterium]
MIISQSRSKVKCKVLRIVDRLKSDLSKPLLKFVSEMVLGMLMTGSCNINLIAAHLKEQIAVKDTIKRLHRMLLKGKVLLKLANVLSLEEALKKIDKDTIFALDGGDITHQYGEKFEKSTYVKDGSSKKGELRLGYWLNQISGYNPGSGETFPILLYIYSTLEKGFKSANIETFKIVDHFLEKIGKIGLWVVDRGYDSGRILSYFLSKELDFMVRMTKSRDVMFKGKSVNIWKRALLMNRRYSYNSHGRFGSCKVKLKLEGKEYKLTLICYKDDRNKEPMIFLTNGWVKKVKELKRRILGYFRRWGVEECYRFEKQGFGIEKSKTRNYARINGLLGLTILSWLVLIKVNNHGSLKEAVLKEARMEKDSLKDRPKFIYYRLLRGLQNMFSGIQRLFCFRLKRAEKNLLRSKVLTDYPLFRHLACDDFWLEQVV